MFELAYFGMMPDVTRFPEMYNLCYDLMKLAWETAQKKS